ncbi:MULTISPECIES: hypothetical protein [unclassified Nostoc]|uniref:hypothetical protein n=1 Tax=unclassified Nostoc TaxID=2593658 RepID=UPI002AD3A3C0|nr:hypothetical protein [Nostoc sp. DedQUE03]MDZ7971721.1 hypothetical protein [Nostoc sp. DedQUE03]MDZ8047297.1 hypothetical protein [Nostoc sp. DedQUE02]
MFSEQGVPRSLAQGGAVPQFNGGTIEIAPAMKPDAIGVQIAQSIYGGSANDSQNSCQNRNKAFIEC